MHTNIPVFSLALVRGRQGSRQWLLYAHAPQQDREGVQINIPHFKRGTVDVPRAGVFYLADEKLRRVNPVRTTP